MYILLHMRINVTLVIDEKVWRAFKIWCIEEGKMASMEVQQFMQEKVE